VPLQTNGTRIGRFFQKEAMEIGAVKLGNGGKDATNTLNAYTEMDLGGGFT